jgi:U32 family peptidase
MALIEDIRETVFSAKSLSPAAPGGLLRSRPEILAPAGNREMMKAAVENGADAVYFGVEEFNARLRANNFRTADLPEIMAWLHERGVKGYITLNTLVFSAELDDAALLLQACSAAGVDAVLVQDLGVARLASQLVPDLPIHASTQMTLTCAESIAAAQELDLKLERVVAPREASIKELTHITRDTDREIEVFVHGALCVAYSGQCLTSEALGGRSANRGECAQACRLPYDMIVDGEQKDLGDLRYLLSPKDLAAYEDIGRLVRAGIVSLKIEGRLKTPEYVAAAVHGYRKAVDAVFADEQAMIDPVMHPETREQLEMTFSRGFTGGYVHEINHQAVVEGRFPKKRGLFLGRVLSSTHQGILVRLEGSLRAGDGVVFDASSPDKQEEGGSVFHLRIPTAGDRSRSATDTKTVTASTANLVDVILEFGDQRVNWRRVHAGDRVWKTSDPVVERRLASSFAGDTIRHRRPVSAVVRAHSGAPLSLRLQDENGLAVEMTDTELPQHAQKRPLTYDILWDQLERLGDTPFYLDKLDVQIDGDLMVPFSRLNDLRRRAAAGLVQRRRDSQRDRCVNPDALAVLRNSVPLTSIAAGNGVRLSVLCRTLEQVEASVALDAVSVIYTDFEDIRLHREARKLIPVGAKEFVPATLRVIKPGEAPFARKLLEAAPDAILIRNLAAWHVLRKESSALPFIGDYSLNVANDLTADLLIQHGMRQLTPSYDLNIDQLLELLRHAPSEWFEVTIHQHIPMFHMEHCVFCRFLSSGTDFTNCGRPCESHSVELRDRVGYAHPVKADAGCRNTVFNAVPQSASEYLHLLLGAKISKFRIEFINESPEQVAKVVNTYYPAVTGEIDGRNLWRQLRASSKLGVTRGSFDH